LNLHILNTKVQDYINSCIDDDLQKFAFKKSPFKEVSSQELSEQLSGKLKAKTKLPTWFNTQGIYYPPKLNLEQTSSEQTAGFKASLFKGDRMADLTGGYGIDTFHFSKSFKQCEYFELQGGLFEMASHNFGALGAKNITTYNSDGVTGLSGTYDLIYLDPARRDTQKSKVFKLEDCSPNILEHLDTLLALSKKIVIKTSPMLDLSKGIEQLAYVSSVGAIAVNNELKELLWVLESNKVAQSIQVYAVNLTADKVDTQSFTWLAHFDTVYSLPKKYLYIPNVALLKLGNYGHLCETYKLEKLHKDTHFFTSDYKIEFPGSYFLIKSYDKYDKRTMKAYTKCTSLVISRNFPLTVSAIRKRWKIADGGNNYLIFTTLQNGEKVVLNCERY